MRSGGSTISAAATAGLMLAGLALAGCQGWTAPDWFNRPAAQRDDDGWTILMATLSSPQGHVQEALHYKQSAEKHTGWKDLFVLHKADHSELYWGRYASPKAAQANLRKAREYVAPAGMKVFQQATVVPVPGKDVGPPEWNLQNAKGAYTVVVAIFHDVPERNYVGRKRYAVDYCRQLRQEQRLEAYYYHDAAKSAVCVGAFDDSAVEVVLANPQEKRPERQQIMGFRVIDPQVNAVMKRFPQLAVNGRSKVIQVPDRVTKHPVEVEMKSYAARIPQKKGPEVGDSLDSIGQQESW